jgi:hypothetical protein
MNDFSIFTVDKKRADEVLNSLQGKKFRGKQVEISKTTMKPSFQGGRRGPSKKRGGFNNRGGFKGKRKSYSKKSR